MQYGLAYVPNVLNMSNAMPKFSDFNSRNYHVLIMSNGMPEYLDFNSCKYHV